MPSHLLLEHDRGGPEPHRPVPPMTRWARAAAMSVTTTTRRPR